MYGSRLIKPLNLSLIYAIWVGMAQTHAQTLNDDHTAHAAAVIKSPLENLAAILEQEMDAVNKIILQRMDSSVPLVNQLAGYLIAAGGKRVRPLLTLASTALYNGEMSRAHLLAACVEFIHSATLLHDDVVDESAERRGKATANEVFGNQASVLVGDFLFSRAFQMMVDDGNIEILRILSDASAVIAQGEVLQLATANDITTGLETYLEVIKSKTAALFAAACEVGPVIAYQSGDIAKSMANYGMFLGIAFQIADDILDYSANREKLGKTIGDDFREGKMTAPVIYAIEAANGEEKKFWQRTLGEKDQKPEDFEQALALINKHGAINKSMDLANHYAELSKNALDIAPDSELKKLLIELVDFSVKREF
jgi:octaprenyl-diphosphate synthase